MSLLLMLNDALAITGALEPPRVCILEAHEVRWSALTSGIPTMRRRRGSVGLVDRLGDFYLRRGERGDMDRALASYEQSLEIGRRL